VTIDDDNDLEGQIAQWRAYVRRHREVAESDADELEDHLRSTVTQLTSAGLRPDEAFLVAVKRMGSLDELSREFAREHSERLWKQLMLTGQAEPAKAPGAGRDFWVMVVCAAAAAIAIKVPVLFGYDFEKDAAFYARNLSLFALPALAAYLAWRRRVGMGTIGALVLLFALGAVGANIYPLAEGDATLVLLGLHLPLALWLAVGVAYVAGDWLSHQRRMDFIRFTGEWFIYYVLIALGGGVLVGVTAAVFNAIGIEIYRFVELWLVPCGALAAMVVAGWLVEAKQSVIENMAPVLTKLFTPLFTAVLVAFLVAVVSTGRGIDMQRDVLILFDFVLVVVLGLLLYSISARDPLTRPGIFDRLQMALVVSALVIDALVLIAIATRMTDAWGFTPNRTAALGENVILLANLAWSAVLLGGFLGGRSPFARLERWQTGYIPVYAVWAWTVVLAFPPIFNYI
jgi:hypothetical protein